MTFSQPPEIPGGLAGLESRVRQDLAWLDLPTCSWVPERSMDGRHVLDVVVVGGGMAGLTASGYLRRYGLLNHVVLDQAPAGQEGPWVTYARMTTLRSPKTLSGPCMGLPGLTFRAWYEARFGTVAWDGLDKIPRQTWMVYLEWLRHVLDLPVRNGVTLTNVARAADGVLALTVVQDGVTETLLCRHLVLATGRDGLGGSYVPPVIAGLPRDYWRHSADPIDFAALKNRRVVVVGAGASAMDNAATALEAGAARVDMVIRRATLPAVNKFTGIGSMGVVQGFVGLPDGWKWRFMDTVLDAQTPPPRPSVLRVSSHPNAFFHLSCPIDRLEMAGNAVRLHTPRGVMETDFIIAATGFCADMSRRPELAAMAPHIRLWKDRFTPAAQDMPSGHVSAELATSPDLGPGFEFLEKVPGSCPWLKYVHCFCFPATLSHGKVSGDIPAISDGAERLARHITRALFVEDRETHYANLVAFDTPELRGDEWRDTPLPAIG
ncbi:NAD(P)/FAD-dependent oxidoreductase [Komagataeibacter xylinus]|uniref:NAD(P)/FAD-dependent oxidoreductase n=1 Tax=Komagataeibacter xylinus TaxID=28448 RepID=A0A318PR49_KOMXY|nr:NAD(P)/FAD-dependent oxidoreductase [Komagataeibacter xylinus]PYD58288.1 NAD(P)/FAD-dependent oxidoreductase [Komagataeibacter xylinus]GBQ78761.1 oxidoreductase [Komagataeibacter xylinus NBRC 15237]